MKKLFLPSAVVLLFASAILLTWWYFKAPSGVSRHSQLDSMETTGAPDFTLPNLSGEQVKLSEIDGHLLIVNFWASWCAPCVEEFPSMMELVGNLEGRVKFVAISEDSSKEDMEAFLKAFDAENNENVVLLWDKDRAIATQYGVDRLPETFLLNHDLKLLRKVAGTMDWMAPSVSSYIAQLAGLTPEAPNTAKEAEDTTE